MELSHEDTLRLNVLLKNVKAVRIDEQAMTVHGLSERGEAKVKLSPNCRPDRYLKLVREFLSGVALGSPGGYPIYLKRWTRMGQISATALAELLMLGEPEAVTAVVRAEGLTEELARRAWWASPVSETARRILAHESIRATALGPELAEFLVEHLPFETNAHVIIDMVRLILQPGLIDAERRQQIWERGGENNVYRVGFLVAMPDNLPGDAPPRAQLATHRESLGALADAGNELAGLLLRVLDMRGQIFIATAEAVLLRPKDQDVVVELLNATADYFTAARLARPFSGDVAVALVDADYLCAQGADAHPALAELIAAVPDLQPEIKAMLVLACANESIVTPVFARTDAVGTVMQQKLLPVTQTLFEQLAVLHGGDTVTPTTRRRRRQRPS